MISGSQEGKGESVVLSAGHCTVWVADGLDGREIPFSFRCYIRPGHPLASSSIIPGMLRGKVCTSLPCPGGNGNRRGKGEGVGPVQLVVVCSPVPQAGRKDDLNAMLPGKTSEGQEFLEVSGIQGPICLVAVCANCPS